MKKIIFFIAILGSLTLCSFTCFAALDDNYYEGDIESKEIMEDIDVILDDVNFCEITQEEIDFDRSVRVYTDVEFPQKDLIGASDMRKYLNDYEYIYYVPASKKTGEYAGDYYLTISKGKGITDEKAEKLNFTDEQIDEIRKLEGKWNVPAVSVCKNKETDPEIIDYRERMEVFLNCYGIEKSENFFVGHTITKSSVMGICFAEGIEEPYYIALDTINPDAKTQDEIKDSVFSYEEAKAYTWEKHYDEESSKYDAGGTPDDNQAIKKDYREDDERTVSNIDAKINTPVYGELPASTAIFETTPANGAKFDGLTWYKIAEADYPGSGIESWTEMSKEETFDFGYYYAVRIHCWNIGKYILSDHITGTVNGIAHNEIFGKMAQDVRIANITAVFEPLTEVSEVIEMPFVISVKQGGEYVPELGYFKLEMFGYDNSLNGAYKDVTYTGNLWTRGKTVADFEGILRIVGPESQVEKLKEEGFFVRQMRADEENWLSSDAVWRVQLVLPEGEEAYMAIYNATKTEGEDSYSWDENSPVEKMIFENTYIGEPSPYDDEILIGADTTEENKTVSATSVSKDKSVIASTVPKTADEGKAAIWFMIIVACGGAASTAIICNRKKCRNK